MSTHEFTIKKNADVKAIAKWVQDHAANETKDSKTLMLCVQYKTPVPQSVLQQNGNRIAAPFNKMYPEGAWMASIGHADTGHLNRQFIFMARKLADLEEFMAWLSGLGK